MKILFIHPYLYLKGIKAKRLPLLEKLVGYSQILPPPLTFPTLAALTPQHHSITFVDERYEKLNFNDQYDLVGITAMTSEINRAYELADEYRRRGTIVVLGGPHVSALPKCTVT